MSDQPATPNQPPARPWENKVCPIFTHAAATQQQSGSLIQAASGMIPSQQKELVAAPCVGPDCAWFLPIAEQGTNRIVGGSCCMQMIPHAINQQSMMLQPITNWLISKNNISKK